MTGAIDLLELKLARQQVKAHVRKTARGKVVPVIAYDREVDFVWKTSLDDGGNWATVHMRRNKRVIARLELMDEFGDQSEFSILMVYVSPKYRRQGVATQLALEFHRKFPKAKLLHGSYLEEGRGRAWADMMRRRYPRWNKRHPDFGDWDYV